MTDLQKINGIEISWERQIIPYFGAYLSVGHIKVKYCDRSTVGIKLNRFMSQIDWSQIKKHGKYLYFAFLFLFDKEYQMTRRLISSFQPILTPVFPPPDPSLPPKK